MTIKPIVDIDHHHSAVKFLMGLGTNPDLTRGEQARLTELLRGPFARGMTEAQANAVLKATVWKDRP